MPSRGHGMRGDPRPRGRAWSASKAAPGREGRWPCPGRKGRGGSAEQGARGAAPAALPLGRCRRCHIRRRRAAPWAGRGRLSAPRRPSGRPSPRARRGPVRPAASGRRPPVPRRRGPGRRWCRGRCALDGHARADRRGGGLDADRGAPPGQHLAHRRRPAPRCPSGRRMRPASRAHLSPRRAAPRAAARGPGPAHSSGPGRRQAPASRPHPPLDTPARGGSAPRLRNDALARTGTPVEAGAPLPDRGVGRVDAGRPRAGCPGPAEGFASGDGGWPGAKGARWRAVWGVSGSSRPTRGPGRRPGRLPRTPRRTCRAGRTC